MVPLDTSIQNLCDVASKLNNRSDTLQSAIKEIEQKIRSSKIGLDIWLSEDEFLCSRSIDGEVGGDPRREVRSGYQIGWARIGNEWRLASRFQETLYTHEEWHEQYDQPTESTTYGAPQPLWNAPRMVRVEAMVHLDRLVGKLASKAEEIIGAIDRVVGPDVPANKDSA